MMRPPSSIHIKELASWRELDGEIARLNDNVACVATPGAYISPLAFRGQSDASWALVTTLERFNPGRLISMAEYFAAVHSARMSIEAFTGREWKLPGLEAYIDWMREPDQLRWPGPERPFPAYAHFAYLRHHGFPSPLLDWTASPHVALFFAYREPPRGSDRVAVFAFREFAAGFKVSGPAKSAIKGLGPNVSTHRRHFLQQCQYTVCWRFDGKQWVYVPHDTFASDQDVLWKFTMPASQRDEVLRHLDGFNLNAYSLFSSEDALMETLARRHLM